MEWRDEGIVIGARKHGETSVIVELMTRAHGRHLGLVRGGRGKRLSPVLQPGNSVEAVWRARIDEQLGMYVIEAGRAEFGEEAIEPGNVHADVDTVDSHIDAFDQKLDETGLLDREELIPQGCKGHKGVPDLGFRNLGQLRPGTEPGLDDHLRGEQ